MALVRQYQATVYDSSRWDGLELRPGDIIISTPRSSAEARAASGATSSTTPTSPG